MRHAVCFLASAVYLFAAPAHAQSRALLELSESERQYLNCIKACEVALDRCSEENRLEVRRRFIDADDDYRVPADKVRAFLDCFSKRNECLAKCEDQLPAG